jgi:hypothetical protein
MQVSHERIEHNSRAVDEDVDGAELLFGVCYQRLNLLAIGDVGGHDQAFCRAALLAEPGLHLTQGVWPARRQRYMRAFACESAGYRRSDAARGPGHHCGPALQRLPFQSNSFLNRYVEKQRKHFE